jgi:hypothetical protein
VAPPGNQAANRENKHQPIVSEETALLDSSHLLAEKFKRHSVKIKIRNFKDFYAGLLFVFFGLLTVVIDRSYSMGTAARMGPGYFPFVLGSILALLGLIITLCSLWIAGPPMDAYVLRPLILITGSVVAFAILVDSLGLVVAILGLVTISSFAGSDVRIREMVILYLILVAMGVGVFGYGLALPFKVLPL